MSNEVEQWIESKFQGLSREDLRKAAKILGLEFGPNTSEQNMRVKLCEKAGVTAPLIPEVKPIQDAVRRGEKKPNLTETGTWEGRRHRVIIRRNPEEKSHKAKVLIWEGEPRAFPFDEIVDLPEPYFNVLNDAKNAHFTQKILRDEEGRQTGTSLVKTPYNSNQFTYIGVTPGTEDLPLSYQDYWRKRAEKSDYFAKYSRQALIKVRSDFVGSIGMDEYRDLTNDDIRADVLRRCGLEHVLTPMDEAA